MEGRYLLRERAAPGRYQLREGSPGGERILGRFDDPDEALRTRDDAIGTFGVYSRRRFDVIDLERVDPPESGVLDWCENCWPARRAAIHPGDPGPICGVCRLEEGR